ncbi:MAG: glucokinase [Pararhodobacter sp.]|nr:glucokinase [Pararhodobacter sp.]
MTETRRLKPFPFTPPPQLVADIGGTHSRVALADHGVLRPGSIRRLENAGQGGLEPLLEAYMQAHAVSDISGLCVAAAGPVRGDRLVMTNLDWTIDRDRLRALAGGDVPVLLINDLQAQGHALDRIAPARIRPLVSSALATDETGAASAARLVVGIGTGFNAVPVHRAGGGLVVPASECGHAHLPAQARDERAFARALASEHALATVEEALCGRGLEAIHRWRSGTDASAAEISAALDAGEAEARATAALYARLLGRALADLALTHLPFGGIYLFGGVARAMAPHLPGLGLAQAFCEMGRYAALMEQFSIHLIEDDYAALAGCAAFLENVTAGQRG